MGNLNFGNLLAQFRQDAGLTLRDFAKLVDYDPSNISKIERGVIAPPRSKPTLRKWARALGLADASAEEAIFTAEGLAVNIQRRLKSDDELAKLLPAFCRTVENKQLDPKTYKRLMAVLRQNT